MVKDLQKLSKPVLHSMCWELQICFSGKKGRLIKQLISFRNQMDWDKEVDMTHVASDSGTPTATTNEPNALLQERKGFESAAQNSQLLDFNAPQESHAGVPVFPETSHSICIWEATQCGRCKQIDAANPTELGSMDCIQPQMEIPHDNGPEEALAVLETMTGMKLGKSESACKTSDHPSYDGLSKFKLARMLDNWTGIVDKDGHLVETHALKASKHQQQRKAKKMRVLGHTTLASIWEDMDGLSLPSWVTPVS
ncbi:hypothetical protein F5J12DRAFT_784517 [Pisolithus orientalis]|uniref:uncharacterized protein n=1 Tax=Pisolithus orientalis TaxID=936130 RepID=UPI0022253AD4|nr:uncharacterized protein F5J12DRAFT_784517 [Pisolithus orientalis]KAI6000215.1 hypothetical protein F5J12DRAFT_784517 [Pisolithus orientalis]